MHAVFPTVCSGRGEPPSISFGGRSISPALNMRPNQSARPLALCTRISAHRAIRQMQTGPIPIEVLVISPSPRRCEARMFGRSSFRGPRLQRALLTRSETQPLADQTDDHRLHRIIGLTTLCEANCRLRVDLVEGALVRPLEPPRVSPRTYSPRTYDQSRRPALDRHRRSLAPVRCARRRSLGVSASVHLPSTHALVVSLPPRRPYRCRRAWTSMFAPRKVALQRE